MQPAYSVIFFTVSSGAGYGLLIWLALTVVTRQLALNTGAAVTGGALALVLVSAGLLSSTFHLGHPERSWRAITQWRTSWLSREGVLAIVTYAPALLFISGWLIPAIGAGTVRAAAAAAIVFAIATIISTGMIYASLKPVPRWHNAWVVPVYLLLGLASGLMIFLTLRAFTGAVDPNSLFGSSIVVVVAWLTKIGYWRHIDLEQAVSTAETATGLGDLGKVSQFEGPHTSDNFVMQEMGYRVARKHADRLRGIALFSGALLPVVAIMVAIMTSGVLSAMILATGTVSGLFGVAIERWLFFAEAKHVVTLYYGETRV